MQISWLVLALSSAHFAIISTTESNATDNDELWTLLLNGRLDQIKTKTAAEVTPSVSSEAAAIHSQNAISGNINYGDDGTTTHGDDEEQLFDGFVENAEDDDDEAGKTLQSLEKVAGTDDDNETMSELFSDWGSGIFNDDVDVTAEGGEVFDDKDGMQADDAGLDDEIINVLRRKPASREVLGLLGLLKERNETEEMKAKLKNVLRPMSERLADGLPSILEEKETSTEPIHAESLVSDSSQAPPVNRILIPKLSEKLPTIRKSYEAPNDGQRSLVIVFDATGSMLDDLHQLRDGAKLIIDEITQLKNNPIYNYVFVPFRDPQVGPRLVTRNKDELLQALEALQIYGGGDCPENAMAALTEAIEAALPNSFVYVFTDATAKDFKLDQRVLRLVQQKQTPITFLLTGFCDGKDTPGHEVMKEIAAASNGQIIDLKKNQIEQVLISIKGMLDVDHVPLKSVDSKTGETHDIDLNVDNTLKEFSVSVSGYRPNIEIIDPQHVPYNKTKPVLDLENIKVVNVADPSPGKWNIKAGSNSSNSVRLSGNSDVKFNFGFSPSKPSSISTLSRQPVLNVDNILTVQPSQPNLVGNLSHVTINSHDAAQDPGSTNFSFKLPLSKHQLENSAPVFVTPGFKSPRQKFKISVVGNDVNGNALDRLISTAIQAVGLSSPELSLDVSDVELLEGDDLRILCRAESAAPMLVQWKRLNKLFAEQRFDSTGTLELLLSNVTTKHSGRYACRAANSVGEQEVLATVKVSVRPEPEVGVYPKDIVAFENERLIFLRCILKNIDSPAKIVWSHNGNAIDSAVGKEYLELYNITSDHDGSYECRVESNGRIHWDTTRISVEYAPKAPAAPLVITAPYGDALLVECGLSGNPKPTVTWSYQSLGDLEEQPLLESNFNLTLSKVTPESEGFYSCEGKNRHGSAKSVIFVRGDANDPPKIPKPEEKILYIEPGARAVLNCSCDLCQPLSEYIWTNGRQTFESSAYDVRGNMRVFLNVEQSRNAILYRLTIDDFSSEDQGSYSCILSNAHGADSFVVEVRLMEATQVDGILVDDDLAAGGVEFVGLQDSVHFLTCDASGLPEPQIQWFVDGELLVEDERYSFHNDNKSLLLNEDFDQKYSGRYTCVATNPLGSSTGELLLQYGGAPSFAKPPSPLINTQVGDSVTLECNITGFPEPDITWFFNDRAINRNLSFEATFEDSGIYTCNASNSFGQLTATTVVLVYGKPQFEEERLEDTSISVSKQNNVSLQCIVAGFPKPNISWTFNDNPIDEVQNALISETGLLLTNVTTQNHGSYVCNAENSIGNAQRVYYIIVKEPPEITTELPDRIQLLPNKEIQLDCIGKGTPPPKPSWFKNNTPLHVNSTLTLSHTASSSGNYTCTLENEEGAVSHTTQVNVIDPPKKSANVSSTDLNIKATLNSPLVLVCPFDNYDNLLWQLNERNLDSYLDLTDVRLLQNILEIEKLRQTHQGTYTCFVENPAGRNNHSFVVGILSPPTIQDAKPIAELDEDLPSSEQVAEVSLLSGEELRLVCHASGSPAPAISWNRDDKVISRGSELTIENVDSHHNGLYTCVAQNELGTARKIYRLDIMSSPQHWGEAISHVEVFKGDDLQLECAMQANPPASFHWVKDDAVIDEFEDTLQFGDIQPSDSGLYTCEAENIFGIGEKKYHVTVYQPAEITSFPVNQTSIAGNTLNIDCEAVGYPLPIISLIHKGEVLASSSDLEAEYLVLDESYRVKARPYAIQTQQFAATKISPFEIRFSLIQANVAGNSAGKYLCLAQNAVGYDERLSKLNVLVPPYAQLHKLKAGPNFAILEGLPLYLFCPITGNPKPALSWYRNSKPIKFNGQTLFLSSTSRRDQGNYTCLGENSVGKHELTFSVSILIPPTMINSVVVRDEEVADEPEQEEISILKGDNVTLDCASLGNPVPEIFWTKVVYLDEKLNEALASKEPVLELYNIESTSTYSCYVNNTAGSTQKLFHIVVQSPPRFMNIEYDPKPTAVLHHSLDLNCEILGVPEADLEWTKDELLINGQQKGFFLASNGQILRISGARSTDAGEYKCVARNLHGQVSRDFSVTIDVPVSWSPWGEWSACSSSCGKGTQFRSRICLLPSGSPAHGKQYNCVGENVQVKNCEMLPCPVNGGWSTWSKWSNCSLECVAEFAGLKSIRFRSRKCDSPPPSLGGKPCIGEENEEEVCNVKYCPVDGGWTPWTNWTPCSEPCGFGRTLRWRSCVNPAPRNGGLPCEGSESEIKICKERECIVDGGWSEWSGWSKCSKTCGVGVKHRKRTCDNPEPKNGGRECKGENIELEKCSAKPCRNAALLKTISRDAKRKFSPLITYESKHPNEDNEDYEEAASEPQKFKVVRNFEFAETPPVEYIDGPAETYDVDDLDNGHHQITVSLKNTVNLTHDTAAYHLNFGGHSNTVEFVCSTGMLFNETLQKCVDVDECETEQHNCNGPGHVCVNTNSGYECLCSEGYRMVLDKCVDVNECREDSHECSHFCVNNAGGYSCLCPAGHVLAHDEKTCTKRRTREEPAFSVVNYEMACPDGFRLDGNKCLDIDECTQKEDECNDEQSCLNTKGSYLCVPTGCPEEYETDVLLNQCFQDCRSTPSGVCLDGAHIEQTLTYKVISLKKYSSKQPIAVLSIPAIQHATMHSSFTFLEPTYEHVFSLEKTPQSSGAVHLYGNKRFQRGKIYKLKIVARAFGKQSGVMDYVHRFIVYVHCVD